MTIWGEVEGRLAILNYPTVDKRVLELADPPTVHFLGLPVPLLLRGERQLTTIGMLERVRLERRQDGHSYDLFGYGQVDVDLLASLRPDLAPRDAAAPPLLLAEIFVHSAAMEVRNEGDLQIVSGAWELKSATIPHEDRPAVWPGLGLHFTQITAEAVQG